MAKTFFGGVDEEGSVWIAAYNHADGTLLRKILHEKLQYDSHCSPSILIRNDNRLIVFYSGHNIDNYIRHRISMNPLDITWFGPECLLNMGGAISYTCPVQLSGESNKIYLFSRAPQTNMWSFVTSTDNGETWNNPQALLEIVDQWNQYIVISSNGINRIDFGHSGHPYLEHCNQYHFYYSGGNYYKSDGTLIQSPLPLDRSDMTLIYDATEQGHYSGWARRMALVDGIPYFVFDVIVSSNVYKYMYAKLVDGAWVHYEIMTGGGLDAGMCIDSTDPNTVYLASRVNGIEEIKKAVTQDGGENWTITDLTSNSAKPNVLPVVPLNRHSDLPVLWPYGNTAWEYDSYTSKIVSPLWE